MLFLGDAVKARLVEISKDKPEAAIPVLLPVLNPPVSPLTIPKPDKP